MSDWIDVDVAGINPEVRQIINGVDVKVAFSPYDVPRRYRGYKEATSDFFTIAFEYLTPEQTKHLASANDCPVEMEVGINSHRIYKILLDVKKLHAANAVAIELKPREEVVDAINRLKQSMPEKLQARYRMPEEIVRKNSELIFSELVH